MTFTRTSSNASCVLSFLLFLFVFGIPNANADAGVFTCELGQTIVQGDTPDGHGSWCEIDGTKEGLYQVTHPNGALKIESYFRDGKQDGEYRMRDANGRILREGHFLNGKMNGNWKRFYSNGNLKDEGSWVEGSPDGLWKFFREDGTLEEEGRYENGNQVCTWKKFSSDGTLTKTENTKPSQGSCGGFYRSKLSLLRFSLEWMFGEQYNSGGRSSSPVFGWQPRGFLGEHFDWTAGLSLAGFKSRRGNLTMIAVLDYSGGIRYYFSNTSNFFLEARVGLQTWTGVTTSIAHMFKVGFNPHWKNLIFTIGREDVYLDDNLVEEMRLGIEIPFGEQT